MADRRLFLKTLVGASVGYCFLSGVQLMDREITTFNPSEFLKITFTKSMPAWCGWMEKDGTWEHFVYERGRMRRVM